MKIWDDVPRTLAERIVEAVVSDIYSRSGGDHWFDRMDVDVLTEDVIPGLVAAVQRELDAERDSR